MARQIDYPRASLKNCQQLAIAVDDLGGKCSIEMAAEKLNKKVGGSFQALVGAAARFGFITNKKGQLEVTQLYRDHKLAYSKEEADKVLIQAFLNPALFKNIFERFKGRELPISHFEKLLIREFSVPEQISSRVAKYFLEGAKQCGLLTADNVLSEEGLHEDVISGNGSSSTSNDLDDQAKRDRDENDSFGQDDIEEDGRFSVRIKGPGMDSIIVINEEEDLLIVRAMLKKVEKKFVADQEVEWGDEND